MNIKVEAKGVGASGKTHALNRITELLEELGFTAYYSDDNEHKIVFWRSDDFHILKSEMEKEAR